MGDQDDLLWLIVLGALVGVPLLSGVGGGALLRSWCVSSGLTTSGGGVIWTPLGGLDWPRIMVVAAGIVLLAVAGWSVTRRRRGAQRN